MPRTERKKATKCLDVTAVGKLMAESRDEAELKRAWLGWEAVGAPMRERYARRCNSATKAQGAEVCRRGSDLAFAVRHATRRVSRKTSIGCGISCGHYMYRCMRTFAVNSEKVWRGAGAGTRADSDSFARAICGARNGTTFIR